MLLDANIILFSYIQQGTSSPAPQPEVQRQPFCRRYLRQQHNRPPRSDSWAPDQFHPFCPSLPTTIASLIANVSLSNKQTTTTTDLQSSLVNFRNQRIQAVTFCCNHCGRQNKNQPPAEGSFVWHALFLKTRNVVMPCFVTVLGDQETGRDVPTGSQASKRQEGEPFCNN